MGTKLFKEEGIFNYSTMLLREDLGVLLLGAREAVYALDIDDVSVRKAVVRTIQKEKEKSSKCVLMSYIVFKAVLKEGSLQDMSTLIFFSKMK